MDQDQLELLCTSYGASLSADPSQIAWQRGGSTVSLPFPLADELPRLRVLGGVGELCLVAGDTPSIEVRGPLAEVLAGGQTLTPDAISISDGALLIALGEVNHAEGLETVLPLARGHADLSVSGKLSLRITSGPGDATVTTSLWVTPIDPQQPAKIAIGFDLIMLEGGAVPIAVRLPGERLSAALHVDAKIAGLRRLGQRVVVCELALQEPTKLLELSASLGSGPAIPDFIWPQLANIVPKIAGLRLRELEGPLFDDLGASLSKVGLVASNAKLTVDADGVTITGLELQIDTPGDQLLLINGELRIDRWLRVRGSAGFGLGFELSRPVNIAPNELGFSLILHGGHRYTLTLEGGGYRLIVDPRGRAQPAASVYVPQLVGDDARKQIFASPSYDGEGVNNRFVLDVLPVAGAPAIEFGPSGGRLRARARRRPITLGNELKQVTVADGELVLRDGRWTLAIEASASLPWLAGTSGRVRVRGGSGVVGGISFDASFQIALGETWTDPSGCLIFRNPAAWVSIAWQSAKWTIKGALSGSLEFGHAQLGRHAAEWVGEIFRGLSVEFDGLSLSELAKLGTGGSIGIKLARGFKCRLWEFMHFDLRGLRLHGGGLGFDGDVGFSLGPVRFGGRLPDLRLTLRHGKVELDTGKFELAVNGALELPSGVRARLDVRRKVEDSGVTVLEGRGSLTVPSLPDAEVLIKLGQFGKPGRRKPTLAIYGEVAAAVHVLPGVVLRRLGVGLGIYHVLRGTAGLARSSGEQLLDSLTKGAPLSPGSGDDWHHDPNTFLTLVARAMATATVQPDKEIDYYVADLLLTMDSNLRFAGWMNAWILSSLHDARSNDAIRRYPHARGAFAFDPRVPSIVAAYRTLPDGRSSLTQRAGVVAKAVTCVVSNSQTQMLFEARPNLLHLRLGPHSYRESLGPLGVVEASSTLAVRVEGSRALASLQTRWAARMSGSFKGRIGPVEFGIAASAGFESGLTVAGGLGSSKFMVYGRGRARAWFRVEAWARISIQIAFRVKLGFFKFGFRVRIETREVRLELGIEAMVDLQAALGSDGVGASAIASVAISIAGITASGTIGPMTYNPTVLEEGRKHALQR